MNHKPEMIYALTEFSALVGFRVPRKARELLVGLQGELAERLRHRLKLSTVRGGLRSLATWLLDEDSPATLSASKSSWSRAAPAWRRGIPPRRAPTRS